jgi:hypothetical protein
VRARDGSLVTIEALMADRLRHSLEELCLFRGVVCTFGVCVMSLKDCRERVKQTNYLCRLFTTKKGLSLASIPLRSTSKYIDLLLIMIISFCAKKSSRGRT